MPTTTPTLLSDAEMELRLDAATLFLDELERLPQFADRAAGLTQLADTVRQARDDYGQRAGGNEADGFAWLEEIGLVKAGPLTAFEPSIDPGYGREILLLEEKLAQLADRVLGTEWDHDARCWRGYK